MFVVLSRAKFSVTTISPHLKRRERLGPATRQEVLQVPAVLPQTPGGGDHPKVPARKLDKRREERNP